MLKEWYVENENDGSGYWSGTFYMRQIKVHHITLHAHIIEI